MKYQVPKGLSALYHNGKKYPVLVPGLVEIPGKQIEGLQPVPSDKKKSNEKG